MSNLTGMRSSRLLYVEDERMLWQITQHKLRSRYEVLCASNAEEAVRLYRDHGDELEAIIMDIDLKRSSLDGAELTQLFRGELKSQSVPAFARDVVPSKVPILFVTAYAERYDESQVKRLGAQGILRKPIDFAELSLSLTRLHLQRLTR
ncbi:MAG: response regulator [Myxococcota bacterium]